MWALVETLFFFGLLIIIKRLIDPYLWRYAGPISLVFTLIVLTLYMRLRSQRWSDAGLVSLQGMRAWLMLIPKILLTVAAMALAIFAARFGGKALGLGLMLEATQGMNDRFANIPGSLPHYLLWMGIVWTSAALGEEMFFRGFLITRLQTVFGDLPFATVLAIVVPALMFGGMHVYYEGVQGLIVPGAIALAFGSMFVLFKRNLWPIIIVHGLVDSVGITAIYMGGVS
jgi:CAAX protease family protein